MALNIRLQPTRVAEPVRYADLGVLLIIRGLDHGARLWIVDDVSQFNTHGAIPTNTIRHNLLRAQDENDWHTGGLDSCAGSSEKQRLRRTQLTGLHYRTAQIIASPCTLKQQAAQLTVIIRLYS
ncbi:hypothetical protein [Uliginosibacterium gangwonense]|uniref:hypothetical protein n=1 Tax=Uliginosibacterium gangwonense TaxID=392736 RepID=UPI0003791692|nr:hypothetical protein [Uliginosibacterium gangwonense]